MTPISRNNSWSADRRSYVGRCILVIMLALQVVPAPAAAAEAAAQVGFSPEGTGRSLVLDVINTARRELRVMAYSFTAPDIAQALIAAKKRGVDVLVVVDADQSRQKSQVAALNTLAIAGIQVRLNGHYQIMHDKVIVADRKTVQTGSFNYTRSAETANSENVIVLWDVPGYAGEFLQHWQSRWDQAAPYAPPY
ncbi:phospholipase D family protein [Rhizobium sp. VS19-DR104.2]|uniref:phospholipase D family nuclease n=1 Tax=Rhizobium/Agrobacterium group TaxID=227290 RepID=UPI001CC4D9C6|nr:MULTISPECIES: phospholipase D family protein [unclassified Rhizobium]MBZ5763343.1 phospholipase D family protein [Rhizobium sp. VS19-DR96]MBZ5769238.1 phospholipase D family protein [Rhizobium sp. VS19-DR129.2]MBZ5776767.1 phospholipase D family protein [Rhizobium sp. VS19-DRK62.2]MBZ5786645.1 phospholipase D family protein [Rhizobium sp. VS19-DR121]MBZ5805296.1 phospholipase D family protein [Rhizobium sp. VS19-DR181]